MVRFLSVAAAEIDILARCCDVPTLGLGVGIGLLINTIGVGVLAGQDKCRKLLVGFQDDIGIFDENENKEVEKGDLLCVRLHDSPQSLLS